MGDKKFMKIAVAGTGYVGLSIATLLAQHNEVWAVEKYSFYVCESADGVKV